MYSTIPNLKAKYPRIEGTQVASSTLIKWIEYADGIIDGYISTVISLPLSPTPPLIEGISTDLAYGKFMLRHSRDAEKDTSINEVVDGAMSLLESIREGKLNIVSSAGVNVNATANAPVSNTSGYVPTFQSGMEPDKWREDPNKTKDETGEVYP